MKKWFLGYLEIAECQVGFAYLESIGTEKDLEKALYWTTRSAAM